MPIQMKTVLFSHIYMPFFFIIIMCSYYYNLPMCDLCCISVMSKVVFLDNSQKIKKMKNLLCQNMTKMLLLKHQYLFFPPHSEYNDYANPLVCAVFVAMCPLWVLIARKIPSTREVLYSGWEPVIIAMAISR